ncbi:MAG: hypothetical protein U0353_19825 [Sandaracinus sp.]|jgi:hypothetical protein
MPRRTPPSPRSAQSVTLETFRRDALPYTGWSDRAKSLDALFAEIGAIDEERECLVLIERVEDLCADHVGYAFGVAERRDLADTVAALERLSVRSSASRKVQLALKRLRGLEKQLAAASRG